MEYVKKFLLNYDPDDDDNDNNDDDLNPPFGGWPRQKMPEAFNIPRKNRI